MLFNNKFIEVNYKRLKLEFTAEELYPEGYDLNQLFFSYSERKLERDIERGSKKGLKKIRKQEGLQNLRLIKSYFTIINLLL